MGASKQCACFSSMVQIEQVGNKYTVQINKTNLGIITQFTDFNEVKFYKEGNLTYQYKDFKINENTFIRKLDNRNFTFKNNELVLLEINKYVKFINTLKCRRGGQPRQNPVARSGGTWGGRGRSRAARAWCECRCGGQRRQYPVPDCVGEGS
jgi:hypothetical protein